MAESLDEPLGVVAGDELADDPPRLGETLETMEVEALLLQRAHEALDDAVALRLADVRRRDRHPQPLHLVDPRIGDVLRAPVASDPQAAGDILREASEHLAHALAERLERGPAITDLRRVPAHELVHAVVDGAEEPAPAILFGVEPCRVGTPHLIRVRRSDRAGVRRIAIRWTEAPGREQVMPAHQAQDAFPADGQAPVGQAGPDLPIAFAVERGRHQHQADRRDDLGIAPPRLRPTLGRNRRPADRRRHRPVDRRAGHAEDGTDHRQRIATARRGAHGASHRRCFFHSSVSPLFSMRCSANSKRIISSPILARASVSSRSSGSLRVLSPRLPCSRKIRFQLSSSWAGTWLSRDTASSPSPRSSRRTSSAFRWMLQRSGSSTSFGGRDGSDGVAGFLDVFPMSGLLGHGYPSQLRVPRNRVRFNVCEGLGHRVVCFVTVGFVRPAQIRDENLSYPWYGLAPGSDGKLVLSDTFAGFVGLPVLLVLLAVLIWVINALRQSGV